MPALARVLGRRRVDVRRPQLVDLDDEVGGVTGEPEDHDHVGVGTFQPLERRAEVGVAELVALVADALHADLRQGGVEEALVLGAGVDDDVVDEGGGLVAAVVGGVLGEGVHRHPRGDEELEHRPLRRVVGIEPLVRPGVVEHGHDRELVASELLLGLLEAQPTAPEDADDVGIAGQLVVRLHAIGRVDAGVTVHERDLAAEDAAPAVQLLNGGAEGVRRDRSDERADAPVPVRSPSTTLYRLRQTRRTAERSSYVCQGLFSAVRANQ